MENAAAIGRAEHLARGTKPAVGPHHRRLGLLEAAIIRAPWRTAIVREASPAITRREQTEPRLQAALPDEKHVRVVHREAGGINAARGGKRHPAIAPDRRAK